MNKLRIVLLVMALVLTGSYPGWGRAKGEGVEVTIYHQNLGLVKDYRFFYLNKGMNEVRFEDIPSQIDPTSVNFKSLTSSQGCTVEEQSYEFDLASANKLLSKYLDKKIKIVTKEGKFYEGLLMSFDEKNLLLRKEAKTGSITMVSRNNIQNIDLPELPEGLITKPTLIWLVETAVGGKHLAEVSYLTKGINWRCNYVAVVDKEDRRMDLNSWVSIDNKSGATYKDASLKLVAGEVHLVEERLPASPRYLKYRSAAMVAEFAEKPLLEYHLYTLERRTTLKNNQIKQISLFSAQQVPINKLFIFESTPRYSYSRGVNKGKIQVKLEFTNSEKENLGIPLPEGKVRVYKEDEEGSLQFVGEDLIKYTPREEKVKIYIGDASDLVGERTCTATRQITKTVREESYKISLRNRKDKQVEIIVIEHLYRDLNWEITQNSHPFTKKDAQTIEFKVKVPKDGEEIITYTVRYSR